MNGAIVIYMVKLFFNYCLIASILIGLGFVASMFFNKRGREKSILYLGLVILFMTLNNLQIVVIDLFFSKADDFFKDLLIPFYALILPSFYTFLTYYLNIKKQITGFVWFTAICFLLELIARSILYHFYYEEDVRHVVAKYAQMEEIINAIFSVSLFVKAFIIIFNPAKYQSALLSYDSLKWLKTFIFLGSVILITWICAIILNLDKVVNPDIFIYYPLRLSSSILIFWVGYQGFFNYATMLERIELRSAVIHDTSKNIPRTVSKKGFEDKFLMISEYIEKNQRYLDPNFSLDNLSHEMKMSVSSISQIINQKSSHNFSDYINELRVERAKTYLTNPDFENYTIVAIGLECGFNSKSTFYAAFKKFTKITPSEFKQSKA